MPWTTGLDSIGFIRRLSTRAIRRSLVTSKLKKRHELTKGHRTATADVMTSQQEIDDQAAKEDVRLACDHTKCSKTSKRRGDLVRHQNLHAGLKGFPCTAQECGFSFTRNDKLHDHVRAGHDCETLFACPRRNCPALLTRDILSMHARSEERRVGKECRYRGWTHNDKRKDVLR